MSSSRSADVVIVGAGAIGVCIAYELIRAGARVTVLERDEAVGYGCSLGNAGLLRIDHMHPLANAAAVRQGLRYMFDPAGSFAFRPRPGLAPWMARFMLAARPARVQESERLLRSMARLSLSVHEEYVREGMDTGLRRDGVMDLFLSERGFESGLRQAEKAASEQIPVTVLSADDLKEVIPGLRSWLPGGIIYSRECHCDPLQFTTAVGASAANGGAVIRTGIDAQRLEVSGRRINAVRTSDGLVYGDQFVISAGVWSHGLAKPLGLRLPVESGKGYHIEYARQPNDPIVPFIMNEKHVAVTPLPGALRLGGTLELSGLDPTVNDRRVDAIRRAGDQVLDLSRARVSRIWSGLRPCSPDGLPMLGRTARAENLFIATGHGMQGIVLAAATGRLTAQAITGQPSSLEIRSMTPDRF